MYYASKAYIYIYLHQNVDFHTYESFSIWFTTEGKASWTFNGRQRHRQSELGIYSKVN